MKQLEQVLVDTIQKATAATGQLVDGAKQVTAESIDFALTQVPDLIHQLLLWKVADATVGIVAMTLLIAVFFKFLPKVVAFSKEDRDPSALVAYSVFGGVILVIGPAVSIFWNVSLILKIWLAPKIYLIEYVSELVK